MAYTWHGDMNPENGGAFLDLDEMAKWKDHCPCIQITDLDSGIGFRGAVMIEQGSVYTGDETKRRGALECIGWDFKQQPDDRTLAEATLS